MKKSLVQIIIIVVAAALSLFLIASIIIYNNVNSAGEFLAGAVISILIIFAVTLVISVLMSNRLAKVVANPIKRIKNKLETVGVKDKDFPIVLTKDDGLNTILEEIESISNTLNNTIIGYETQRKKLRFILENINQGILALDKNNCVVMANSLASDIFGSELPDGMHISKFVRNQEFYKNVNDTAANNKMLSYDYTNRMGNVLEVKMLPISEDDISAIVVLHDVTSLRKLQTEKQEFFQNASHELNTPLSSVLGYAEMLLKENKFNKDFINIIIKEAERMKALISEMLKISELETNKEIIDEKIDLKVLAENAVTSYLPKAEIKKIKINSSFDSCLILANREKITEVICNLLDNAIKYSNENSLVDIFVKKSGAKAILSVKDNGIGIPTIYLNRIFERFFRIDKGRSKKEDGTGLGLAITKHICNHYNASISVSSIENNGTEITIGFNLV